MQLIKTADDFTGMRVNVPFIMQNKNTGMAHTMVLRNSCDNRKVFFDPYQRHIKLGTRPFIGNIDEAENSDDFWYYSRYKLKQLFTAGKLQFVIR